MQELSADLKRLEYYQRREARRTFVARTLLIAVIFGMLGANMWMTNRVHDDMLTNMDQARLEQAALIDNHQGTLEAIDTRLGLLEAEVDAMEAQTASTAEALATR